MGAKSSTNVFLSLSFRLCKNIAQKAECHFGIAQLWDSPGGGLGGVDFSTGSALIIS